MGSHRIFLFCRISIFRWNTVPLEVFYWALKAVALISQIYHKKPRLFFCQPCAWAEALWLYAAPKYSPEVWAVSQLLFILMLDQKFSCCASTSWGLPTQSVFGTCLPSLHKPFYVFLRGCFHLIDQAYRSGSRVSHLAQSAAKYLWILGMHFILHSPLSWQPLLWNPYRGLPPGGLRQGSMLTQESCRLGSAEVGSFTGAPRCCFTFFVGE